MDGPQPGRHVLQHAAAVVQRAVQVLTDSIPFLPFYMIVPLDTACLLLKALLRQLQKQLFLTAVFDASGSCDGSCFAACGRSLPCQPPSQLSRSSTAASWSATKRRTLLPGGRRMSLASVCALTQLQSIGLQLS